MTRAELYDKIDAATKSGKETVIKDTDSFGLEYTVTVNANSVDAPAYIILAMTAEREERLHRYAKHDRGLDW